MTGLLEASSPLRMRAFPLLAALALAGCGGAPQPPAAAPAAAPPPAAEAPVAPGAPAIDAKAAEACIVTANAQHAKFSGEPAKVTVKHVLVKYAGAKNADPAIHRTREEACLRALEARDKMRAGADIADVVKEYSDEAGAATREGSIGAVERKDVVKAFADAAFELSLNEMSDLVESEFGFHIILRTQ